MNEATRLEIVQRHQQDASIRSIAKELGRGNASNSRHFIHSCDHFC
jgi:transposase-like protein